MYCHLLAALVQRDDIQFVHSTFAYTICEALRTLEAEWPCMCDDIRDGALSAAYWCETDEASAAVRDAMHRDVLSRPRPELACDLARVFSDLRSTQWAGLVPALWPNCKYVLSIMTGAMEPYTAKLQHYAGGYSSLRSVNLLRFSTRSRFVRSNRNRNRNRTRDRDRDRIELPFWRSIQSDRDR
jgi:hypothetical protein